MQTTEHRPQLEPKVLKVQNLRKFSDQSVVETQVEQLEVNVFYVLTLWVFYVSDVQSILQRLGSDGSLLKESVLIGCSEQNQALFCLDLGKSVLHCEICLVCVTAGSDLMFWCCRRTGSGGSRRRVWGKLHQPEEVFLSPGRSRGFSTGQGKELQVDCKSLWPHVRTCFLVWCFVCSDPQSFRIIKCLYFENHSETELGPGTLNLKGQISED